MLVNQIVSQLQQANYNLSDLLILSPYKSYLDTLNVMVQETYLKDSYQYRQNIMIGTRLWCIGDRVMMTKNNYEIGVMNGEEGFVQGITNEGVNINFKDTLYTFKFNSDKQEDKEETLETAKDTAKDKDEEEELLTSDLIHSFAISVHKSQGSEANYVILFIPDDRDFNSFLNINLLYTAITRTRKCIWIVSSQEVLGKISMTPLQQKTDGLADRLLSMKNKEKEAILETLVLAPDFSTSLNNDTALTSIPSNNDFDDQDLLDELYAMYDDE
jgi:exodeoxyribonuclease V alpha subunit